MTYLLPFLYIVIFSSAITYFVNKKIGYSFLLSYIITTLLVYLGGLVGDIRIGIYIGLLFIAVFIVLLIINICKSKKDVSSFNKINNLIHNIFHWSLLLYVVVYFIIVFISYNKQFSFVDEFFHWGVCVKEQVRLYKLYCVDDSLVFFHRNYPPFLPCLESLWCIFELSFSEPGCYRAILSFEFTILISVITSFKVDKKNYIKIIFVLFIFILSGLIINSSYKDAEFSPVFYNSIYSDWPLALMCGYVLYILISDDRSSMFYIKLSLCLSAISLTKQFGLLISLLIVFLLTISAFIKKDIKNIKYYSFFAFPFLLYLLWFIYYNSFSFNYQFGLESFNLKYIISTIMNNGYSSSQINIINNYLWSVKHTYIINGIIKCNYFVSVLIVGLLLYISLLLLKKDNHFSYCSAILYIALSILYFCVMFIMYLFIFSEEEGIAVSCYERYMSIYIFIGYSCCIFLIIKSFLFNKHNVFYILIIILMLVLCNNNSYKTILANKNEYTFSDAIADFKNYGNGKLIIVDEKNDVDYDTILCCAKYHYIYNDDFSIDNIQYSNNLEENIANYSLYDYIYIESKTDNTILDYKTHILYKINENDNTIGFEPIK